MGKASRFFAGIVWGAALTGAAIVTVKTAKEIKNDITELLFTSVDEKNSVKIEFGSSSFAKGLTMFKVTAKSEGKEEDCRFVFFAGSRDVYGEWKDDDHFELLAGRRSIKHLCDVNFAEKDTAITYSLKYVDECEDDLLTEDEE